MLIQDDCEACKQAKEILKESIKSKRLILIDINSEKGLKLAEKFKIDTVPTIINKNDKLQQKCFISKDYSKMYCDDGTEKQLIKKSE